MAKDWNLVGALAAALLGAVLFGWLFTLDVYVEETSWADEPAFCGSAYDVVLLKGDEFLGGEVPPNQDKVDEQCLSESRVDVALAGLAALASLAAGGYAISRVR